MGAFSILLKNLGPARLAMMAVVAIGVIGFIIFAASRLGGQNMQLLYGDLEQEDAGRIIAKLEEQKVPFQLQGNGSRIMVPADQVGPLRLSLASQGLAGGASIGYEIFDDTNSLGTTNFMQNVNLVRALEGELARTIRTLQGVDAARVHLVLPRRQLFSREKQVATASVILKLRGAASVGNQQVLSIQHLVAAAVPELNPSSVSVIDDRGNLLAKAGEDSAVAQANSLQERRIGFEQRMVNTITQLLEKHVGIGKVTAQVTADLDFDRITTTEETFDPDGQVVRSTNTVEESSQSDESEGEQPVSVGTNLPDANGTGQAGPRATNRESRTEEVTNFEISKKITNHVREKGVVKRLSVAVLVDGIRELNDDGDEVYKNRPAPEMENLAKLVASAIGFNPDRGDRIEVLNMQFAPIQVEIDEPLDLFFGLEKNDLLKFAEVIVLAILAILILLLVVRPLVTRMFEALPSAAAAAQQKLLEEQAAAQAALAPPESPPEDEELEELIDIDRVEGRVRASSVKKVGEIVEKHPEEALSIVRNWMYQES